MPSASFFSDLQDPSISDYEVARVLSRASLEYAEKSPTFITSNPKLKAAIIKSLTQEYKRDLSLREIDRPAGSVLVRILGVQALAESLDPSSTPKHESPVWQLVDSDLKTAFTNALLERGESNSANYAWSDLARFPVLFEKLVPSDRQYFVIEATLQKMLNPADQPRAIDGGWSLSTLPKLFGGYGQDRQEFLLSRRDLFQAPRFSDLAARQTQIAELQFTTNRELDGIDGLVTRLVRQGCSQSLAATVAGGTTGTGKN